MLSMRGAQGLGWALLVGIVAGLQLERRRSRTVVQADTAGANLKAIIQNTNSWAAWLLRERQHHELWHVRSLDLGRGARGQPSEHLQFVERQFFGLRVA